MELYPTKKILKNLVPECKDIQYILFAQIGPSQLTARGYLVQWNTISPLESTAVWNNVV